VKRATPYRGTAAAGCIGIGLPCRRGGRMPAFMHRCAAIIVSTGRRQLSRNSPLRAGRSSRQLRRKSSSRKLRSAARLRTTLTRERIGFKHHGSYVTAESFGWTHLHQGGRLDLAAGLYDFRHRDYAPFLGRWTENDPSGYINGVNLYQYIYSNPVSGMDPEGLANIPNFPFIPNRGHFVASVKYNDDFSSDTDITFVPNPNTKCSCTYLAFFQFINEHIGSPAPGNSYQLDNVDPTTGKRGFAQYWYLYPDQSPGIGGNAAAMSDQPGASSAWNYWAQDNGAFNQTFLSTAVCLGGADANHSYGTIPWLHVYNGNVVTRQIGGLANRVNGLRTDPLLQSKTLNYIPTY